MPITHFRINKKSVLTLLVTLLIANCLSTNIFAQKNNGKNSATIYVCTPCGYDCDKATFTAAGTCAHCNMPLVKKSTVFFKNVSAADICKYLSSHPKTLLLDVRTKEEFEGKADPNFGSLKNAINIPVQELAGRMNEMKKYQAKEIIVYCSHGHRSEQASYLLNNNGFTNIINMTGGMSVVTNKDCKK